MDHYITGAAIRRLREQKNLTQAELAALVDVSPKTVSKWETARGLPDVSLLDAIAAALDVSVLELMSGNTVSNKNTSGNLLRSRFYCCPICANTFHAMGEAVISCCGVTLPPLEAEAVDAAHAVTVIEHRLDGQHQACQFTA